MNCNWNHFGIDFFFPSGPSALHHNATFKHSLAN